MSDDPLAEFERHWDERLRAWGLYVRDNLSELQGREISTTEKGTREALQVDECQEIEREMAYLKRQWNLRQLYDIGLYFYAHGFLRSSVCEILKINDYNFKTRRAKLLVWVAGRVDGGSREMVEIPHDGVAAKETGGVLSGFYDHTRYPEVSQTPPTGRHFRRRRPR